MNLHEWALIIFTVVLQMAVGSFVILGGVHFFAARRYGLEEADKLSNRALLAIGPVVILGLVVTLFHLGNPINAPRAIANIGTSWLSREIVLSLAFFSGGAFFALLQWRNLSTPRIRNLVGLSVAGIGIVLVYAMAMVYRLSNIPAWDSVATPLAFYVTTLLLGGLAIGAAFIANFWYLRRKNLDTQKVQYAMLATSLRWIAQLTIAMLGLQFIIIPLYITYLSTHGTVAANESLAVIAQRQGLILGLRLVLLFLGAGLLSVFVYTLAGSEDKLRIVSGIAYLAFALVLIAEILGRYLFYASMVQVGL